MKKRKPFVSIIIVNHNGKKLLKECLNSVFEISYPETKYEVIVVDNCSKDNSVDFIKKEFSKVKIIKNDINNYCRANNIAIKESKGKYIVLLNNDTKVGKDWLIELVKVADGDISIGAVSSKSLYEDGTIQNAGLIPLPNFYWEERGSGKKIGDYSILEEIPALSNIAALYRKEALEKVGFFDEDFNMYYEDVDMSYRLKKAGWKMFFVPKAIIYHKFHGTSTEELATYYIERNRLLFVAKHEPYKLSNVLLGSGYFTSNKSLDNTGKLFEILSKVLYKLSMHVDKTKFKEILDYLFLELEKILNYENKCLSEILSINHKDVVEKNKILNKVEKELIKEKDVIKKLYEEIGNYKEKIKINKIKFKEEIENLQEEIENYNEENRKIKKEYKEITESLTAQVKDKIYENLSKDAEIIDQKNKIEELNENFKLYKEEISTLSKHLKSKLDDILIKDAKIIAKDKQLRNYKEELDVLSETLKDTSKTLEDTINKLSIRDNEILELQKELNDIYNSEGFKFILKPLWWIIFNIRLYLKNIVKKIFYALFILVSFMFLPIYILISVLFLLEDILWKTFKPLFKKSKKERFIVSYEKLKISLVIPNWNGINYLEKCLPSIFNIEDFKNEVHEVLIVDDASTDNSVEYIEKNFPQVNVFKNKKNRKFGYTCNKAVKEAKNELIVLINNDIIVTEDFLEPLVDHFKDESIFAVSPKLYGWDKKTFKFGMHMGRFENGHVRFWNESETENGDKINQTSPSLIAVGGAMVFRKNDFLWLGGFDSIFKPNCWEDIDISYRAWKRGLKILYEPKSLLYHKDAATLSYEKHKEIKNELLFTWKNITDWNILKQHLGFLYINLLNGGIPFTRGFLWALRYLPKTLVHRFKERIYSIDKDKVILDGCMKYYRNFKRCNFKYPKAEDKRYILLVSRFIPYPLNVGGKVRIYNLVKSIKDKYNVILLSLIDKEDEENFIPELKKVFKQVYLVFAKSTPSSLFPNRYRFSYSKTLITKLEEIQKDYPIDIVHIESNELIYLSGYAKHVPVIYTEHDISLMSFYKSYYKYKKHVLFQEFYDYLKKVYLHSINYKKFDKIISLSKKDIKVIKDFFPYSNISYIPTGTDIDYFKYNYSHKDQKIIHIGHYLHYPNEEAVIYFARKIFPKIKQSIPETEFLIVGSGITSRVRKLNSIPGVKLIGEVNEVKSYLYKSSVFVNPTRISAGIKGKVLEAMACGVPVVSTVKGAWGLEVIQDKEILLANNPTKFAEQVVRLLKNKKLHYTIALNARKMVEKKYSWQTIASCLDKTYQNIISKYNLIDTNKDYKEESVKKKVSLSQINSSNNFPIQKKNIIKFPEYSDLLYKVKNEIEDLIEQSNIEGPELGPKELHIELSYLCQSKCIMCDVWDYKKRENIENKELKIQEIKNFIDQSSYLKRINTIVLSGGEPFLRNDLVEICGYLISSYPKACINILTNMIDTKNILNKTERIINKYRPSQLWLSTSIDGIGEVHDKIRGHKGAFDNLMNTIKQCKKKFPDVKLASTFTVTPDNSLDLLKVKRLCFNLDIDFFAQFAIQKSSRKKIIWTKQHFDFLQKDINLIIKELIAGKSYSQIKNDSSLMSQLYYWSHFIDYQKNPIRFFKKCIAGSRFAMFSPYGELFFCPVLKDKIIGNICDLNFDTLWMSKKANKLRDYIDKRICHCCLLCAVYPLLNEVLDCKNTKTIKHKKIAKKNLSSTYISNGINIAEKKDKKMLQIKNKLLNDKETESNKIILNTYPQEIGVGTHYFCNAKCKFCKKEIFPNFSLEIYKKFIEKELQNVFPYVESINFCGWGELFLMPKIEEFLKYLNQTLPDKRKIITTNGIVLDKNILQILKDNFYCIQVSLHASNAKLHRNITLTDSFNNILKNIENLIYVKNGKENIQILLKSTLTTLNLEDLPDFIYLANKLGIDQVECNYMTIYNDSQIKLSCFFQQDLTNDIFDRAQEIANKNGIILNLPPRFKQKFYEKKVKCYDPWKYFYVEVQGSVTPCCFAGKHIGYLNRDNFEYIWNNRNYQKLRRNLVNDAKEGDCRFCYKYNPENVNDIRGHISFRPEVQCKILPHILLDKN